MAYQHLIRRDLDQLGHATIDPRHVEASMAWDRAVQEAVAEVQAMGPEISEALAANWGL